MHPRAKKKAPAPLLPALASALLLLFACSVGESERQNTPVSSDDGFLSEMDIDEKLGQLLIVAFRFWEKPSEDQTLTPRIEALMRTVHPAGVILFAENLDTKEQSISLIQGLQSVSDIPLFIAVDEEGGRVSRAGKNPRLGVTRLPSARTLGALGVQEVEKAGRRLAVELKALGVNMNLAPVADLDLVPGNPLGDRAFSADPSAAAPLVAAFSRALSQENLIPVLKHFPGLGSAAIDPHDGLPTIPYDPELLEGRDGLPFRQALSEGADAVMLGHIRLAERGKTAVPATFSRELITGVLRQRWGFQGLVITDALNMKAIRSDWTEEEAAVLALEAGADLILMPSHPLRTLNGLKKALETGRLTEKRIDDSIKRILSLKRKRFPELFSATAGRFAPDSRRLQP